MGNRAIVIFENRYEYQGKVKVEHSPAIYLHWNGGPESVYAFLDAAKRYGCRGCDDPGYAAARFCQLIGNFFGGTLSLGILNTPKKLETLDQGDNGIYVVTADGMRRCSRGRWYTAAEVETEKRLAYKHSYHTGKRDDGTACETMPQQIDKANAPFIDSEHKDAA